MRVGATRRDELEMVEKRATSRVGAGPARVIALAIVLGGLISATPACFADQLALSVERPQRQTVVLTQGFSTTIHGERPFGRFPSPIPTSWISCCAPTRAQSSFRNVLEGPTSISSTSTET
jgi:hypothetical protein